MSYYVKKDITCPYEWFDNPKKFDHKGLPSRHYFYSRLRREDIKEEEYNHAQKV